MSVNIVNKFCSACANPLIETAVICPKCGSPTSKYLSQGPVPVKSKATAVVLAVFLGIWSWLYTYDSNKKKFWVAGATFLGLTLLVVIRGAFVAYRRGLGLYSEPAEAVIWGLIGFVWLLSPIGLGIWAIIDNATKSASWYEKYESRKSL